ncbi:hypothetical protein AaE_011856, partial [Aphanomyces astaci]
FGLIVVTISDELPLCFVFCSVLSPGAQAPRFAVDHGTAVLFNREISHELTRDARRVEHNLAPEAVLAQVTPELEQNQVVDCQHPCDVEGEANTYGRCAAKVEARDVVNEASVDTFQAVGNIPSTDVVVLDVQSGMK